MVCVCDWLLGFLVVEGFELVLICDVRLGSLIIQL